MKKAARRRQINLRLDDRMDADIEELRSLKRPIPSVTEVLREALEEKLERELKARRRA